MSCNSIGPVGGMRLDTASLSFNDMKMRSSWHAGFGGVGVFMGSKNIRAIVLDSMDMKMRSPQGPEKFKSASKKFVEDLRGKHQLTSVRLPVYGTN